MRSLALLPFAVLLAGCLGPGERDPTRYPWQQPKRAGVYCVVALQPASSGIVISGGAGPRLGCPAPPPQRAEKPGQQ
jgi:hypothetical protein